MNSSIRIRKVQKREAGQAMVEYAFVALFLFVLFVSIFQIILMMYAYTTFANAAKEGIRYAVVHGTGSGTGVCSGPGDSSVTPKLTCTDSKGTNVQTWVTNYSGLSFQQVTTGEVTVDYDPSKVNTNSSIGGPCSSPGCLVRVTVTHVYKPLFGLHWANFTLNAAAEGRIMN